MTWIMSRLCAKRQWYKHCFCLSRLYFKGNVRFSQAHQHADSLDRTLRVSTHTCNSRSDVHWRLSFLHVLFRPVYRLGSALLCENHFYNSTCNKHTNRHTRFTLRSVHQTGNLKSVLYVKINKWIHILFCIVFNQTKSHEINVILLVWESHS